MKLQNLLTAGLLLLANSTYAAGFGVNLGPFDLELNAGGGYSSGDGGYYADNQRNSLDNPICNAISHQKRLEMVIEGKEKISSKEIKIITKKLIVEPYAFGVTREGKPVLRGNVIEDKMVREVTVKYAEDPFNVDETTPNDARAEDRSFFSGWFKSDKDQNIDISKLSNIQVINDSHFDAPKDYKGMKDENIRVICELPITKD